MSAEFAVGLVVVVLVIALILGCFAFWIAMMVNAAKNDKWVWFGMVLVFPLLCVVYALFARAPRLPGQAQRIEPGL